jgi:hypothetical protein
MILCVSLSLNSYSIWEVGVVDIVLETASQVFVTVTSKCTFDRIFGQLTNLPMPGRQGIGRKRGAILRVYQKQSMRHFLVITDK